MLTIDDWNAVQEAIAASIRSEAAQILAADIGAMLERDRQQVEAIGRWLDTCRREG
ncbi:MAG: hypothetical protein HC769_35625 [Cyanobacteria bacterium CRU_2_1]|nr:hypothetical protein [Cyanobacteria bacterium CRU_2_1]